jgi:hypothetical protein
VKRNNESVLIPSKTPNSSSTSRYDFLTLCLERLVLLLLLVLLLHLFFIIIHLLHL